MEKMRHTVKKAGAALEKGASQSFSEQSLDPFSVDLLTYSDRDKSHLWSVSWSDLMMTMFIFFVILYVYQAGSRELRFGPGPGANTVSEPDSGEIVEVNLHDKPSEIFNQTRQAVLDEFVEGAKVDLVEDRAVRISLAGDLFFDVGKADLKPEARWRLNQIGKILQENSFIVNVIGHTDSMPNHSELYSSNWELSTARACRVARYLIKDVGVAEDRFFVSGHASLQPLVPNNTARNRSLNRRVEIILMKERPYVDPVAGVGSQSKNRTVNNG
ncbi:MAG: flagellar motor protein MotB [Desulfobacteraceae bacterium]|nr:flagellar motor protein MotB [Desulfobacteraceae bacterium]